MSFGDNKTTQTTKVELSKEQKELLGRAMPYAKQFAANPPQLPTSPMTAGFDPAQLAGQQSAIGAAPRQAQVAEGAAGATDFLLNKALFPETNPALRQTIDAAVRPIYENLQTKALPAVRNEAAMRGQYGGSRQGVAEGLAIRDATQAAADTSAKVSTEGYKSGLDAMYRALGLAPQTADLQVTPALTLSGVGDVRQGQQQRVMDEATSRAMYAQTLPLMTAQELVALSTGTPGGSAISTGTAPKANPLTSGLGSALTAAGAGFGPLGMGVAGGLGALLSML